MNGRHYLVKIKGVHNEDQVMLWDATLSNSPGMYLSRGVILEILDGVVTVIWMYWNGA